MVRTYLLNVDDYYDKKTWEYDLDRLASFIDSLNLAGYMFKGSIQRPGTRNIPDLYLMIFEERIPWNELGASELPGRYAGSLSESSTPEEISASADEAEGSSSTEPDHELEPVVTQQRDDGVIYFTSSEGDGNPDPHSLAEPGPDVELLGPGRKKPSRAK